MNRGNVASTIKLTARATRYLYHDFILDFYNQFFFIWLVGLIKRKIDPVSIIERS